MVASLGRIIPTRKAPSTEASRIIDTALLTLNAGSSSLEFGIYRADVAPTLQAEYRGAIVEIGGKAASACFTAPLP